MFQRWFKLPNTLYRTPLQKSTLTIVNYALTNRYFCLQFKHVPLYLEWAPLGVFSGKPEEKLDTSETSKEDKVCNMTAIWVLLYSFIIQYMEIMEQTMYNGVLLIKHTDKAESVVKYNTILALTVMACKKN